MPLCRSWVHPTATDVFECAKSCVKSSHPCVQVEPEEVAKLQENTDIMLTVADSQLARDKLAAALRCTACFTTVVSCTVQQLVFVSCARVVLLLPAVLLVVTGDTACRQNHERLKLKSEGQLQGMGLEHCQ